MIQFKLSSPLMSEPGVKRLQELLLALGFDVGPTGPDGIFGKNTEAAVIRFQHAHHLAETGMVDSEKTWPMLQAALEAKENEGEAEIHLADRREMHPPPKLFRADWSPRAWQGAGPHVIRGVTLHQTGILLTDKPKRWDNINAHLGVLRDGTIVLANSLEWFIWHAQELSHFTIGIEFNGNFEGVQGDPHTLWKGGGGPHTLTSAQLRAADQLFHWLKEQFLANGGQWEFVHAHRQASLDRRGDPGSEIWQKIALPWMQKLGASDGGPTWHLNTGRPIPTVWNSSYPSSY